MLLLIRCLPKAAGWRQPAADAYVSGTPTPFILISQRRSSSSSNACLIQSEKVLNVNSWGRSRPPTEARARGSPARTRPRRMQSGRLDLVSSLPLVLGETPGSLFQSLIVSGTAVRPAWACDQPDRTPHTLAQPPRFSLDLQRDRTQRPRAGIPVPARGLCTSDRLSCTNGACPTFPSCVLPSFGRERQSQQSPENDAGYVRCRSHDQPTEALSRRDRPRRGRGRARPRRPLSHRYGRTSSPTSLAFRLRRDTPCSTGGTSLFRLSRACGRVHLLHWRTFRGRGYRRSQWRRSSTDQGRGSSSLTPREGG